MSRFLLLGAILLAACDEVKPLETATTQNATVDVEKLFTYEGCTMYRFHDDGKHYFAVCTGVAATETTRSPACGKGCVRQVTDVIAVRVPAAEAPQ